MSFFFFFLALTFLFVALAAAVRKKRDISKIPGINFRFFYYPFQSFFFQSDDPEELSFSLITAAHISRFLCYFALFYAQFTTINFYDGKEWLVLLGWILFTFAFADYLPRIVGYRASNFTLRFLSFPASFFLIALCPINFAFLKISGLFSKTVYFEETDKPGEDARQEIMDMVQEATLSPHLEVHDKKIFESVLDFRERIAREIMVPRVDMFSLSGSTSIKDAARQLDAEGYSRIPVYRDTIDDVTGVLMYKDILTKYMEYEESGGDERILNQPIETIQKQVLYTPETKKISRLLQEFRKRQVHLAIVVDEYGGTEGLLTIEDILEEIVGEISDEYDEEEETIVTESDGSWIVDARMSILDIEERLGISIPQESDYDTLGGYIFHCTGTIPEKGFVIHHDDFQIEILESNDRSVEKVRLRATNGDGNPT